MSEDKIGLEIRLQDICQKLKTCPAEDVDRLTRTALEIDRMLMNAYGIDPSKVMKSPEEEVFLEELRKYADDPDVYVKVVEKFYD